MASSTITGSTASSRSTDPKNISITKPPKPDYLSAAHDWFRLGPWLKDLSELKIYRYWKKHPNHELGFIVGPDLIVFDADTPQSLARLCEIERTFGVSPALSVKTRRGEHHYFKLSEGTLAKSDSHSSEKHPDRIDVKTGRALIVLPPSGGKEVIDND
jgi:hypothetical protein